MNFKFKTAAITAISMGALVVASAQSTPSCFQFTQNLKLGSSGAQVMQLQKSLNSMGYTVASTGVGSMGMETSYFGAATKRAAINFQSAKNLPATGNVFALTRAALNSCGSVVVPPNGSSTPTTSGSVSVSLAASQPSNVVVSGSARAKLADVVFSGNGSVVSVKLMRTGVSNNNTLSNVYLYDASTGMRLTDAASVLTDGTVTFNSASGLFMVSGSKTVSILADVAASTSGQTVGFSVIGYTVTGSAAAVVSGVNGPVLPIAAADLATATFASTTPATTSMNAGTTGATVWSSSLNVGIRAVNLSSLTFKMVGSAPIDALANVKLYVDGVQFANASAFSANGYVTFYSASPLALTTGSHTFDVRADIVKGSSRSFYVSIENAGDIALQDSQLYGANVSVKYNGNIISNLLAGTITITGGSLTISQNSAFNTSSLVGGSTNQTLGSFKFYAYGEDVKVQYLTINATATAALTPSSAKMNNVTVYVNGGAVSSGIQATLGSDQTISLGSNLIIPAGSSAIVEVKGDLVNENNANITAGTVRVDVKSSGSTAQGQYSYNSISVPAATGQGLSINSGNVSFGATSGFTAANISKNQASVKIASFSLQAGSAEAVNVTNINILLNGSSTPASEYTNLKITDGSQTVVPTSGTNNFSVNYDVAAGSTKTIEVWVDTLEIANGKTIIASSTVTYRGKLSSVTNTVSATAPAMTAASVSVGTPTLVSASTLGARYVIGGNTVNSVATYNVTSTNGSSVLNDLTFTIAGSVAGPGVESLTIGSVTAPVVGSTANFYGINLSVPSGTAGLNIPVAIKYSAVTAANQGGVASAATSSITLSSMKYTAGGTQTTVTPSVAANTMTLVASLPTVKKTSTAQSFNVGTTTNAKIGTITVSADAKGDVTVFQLPYSVTASNVIVKANGTDVTQISGTASATSTIFASGYRIAAGTSVTFDIYGDVVNGGTTSSTYDVSVGSAAAFKWSDVVDGITTTGSANKFGTLLTTYNN